MQLGTSMHKILRNHDRSSRYDPKRLHIGEGHATCIIPTVLAHQSSTFRRGGLMRLGHAMTSKLKRHIKLLEAIAMVLALFVWAMEWSSVQHWASASSDFSSINQLTSRRPFRGPPLCRDATRIRCDSRYSGPRFSIG